MEKKKGTLTSQKAATVLATRRTTQLLTNSANATIQDVLSAIRTLK